MRENGYDCTLEDLSELRRVAYVFGQSTRRSEISWDLHAEAGTPEMLEAIMGGIPKGTPLTKSYIAFVRKQWNRHRREGAKGSQIRVRHASGSFNHGGALGPILLIRIQRRGISKTHTD